MICRFLYIPLLFISFFAFADEQEVVVRRVQAHLMIGDYHQALQEAKRAIPLFKSQILWEWYIRAAAKANDDIALLNVWKAFVSKFPEEKENRALLEVLAWGVIENNSSSSNPIIRLQALLGAIFSQDAKGISLLQSGMQDPHAGVQGAAIKLSSMVQDQVLQDEVLKILTQERRWKIRLEAVRAAGRMKIKKAGPYLMQKIADEALHKEEIAAAIKAYIEINDEIFRSLIVKLVRSQSSGMKLLACEWMIRYEKSEDIDLILPLISDHNADVRAKALEIIGKVTNAIPLKQIVAIATEGIKDKDRIVSTTAMWLLTLKDPQNGQKAFENRLNNGCEEEQYMAASALAATGKYGLPLMRDFFLHSTSSVIRMNLALGLIGQRQAVTSACSGLYEGLLEIKGTLAFENIGSFRTLIPSQLKHDEAIANYPEAVRDCPSINWATGCAKAPGLDRSKVIPYYNIGSLSIVQPRELSRGPVAQFIDGQSLNQITRLEVLQILAILEYPKAQEAIKLFLKTSQWGVTGLASLLLLTEGDEEAAIVVERLLGDQDQKVRVQAALILALWGRGDNAIHILQEAYSDSHKELKEQILEAIGKVGSPLSLTFLVDKLQEPFPSLRLIAASALLECLYH